MRFCSFIRCGLILSCFLASCKDGDDGAGESPFVFGEADLEAWLGEGCWQEKTYFVYDADEGEVLSESLEDLWLQRYGEEPEEDCRLATFRLEAAGWLEQYYLSAGKPEQYRLRQRILKLDNLPGAGMVRIRTADSVMHRKSWVAGEEMQLIKASDWEVVLESPVKEYTRRMWAEDMPPNTRCLRSVWTRVDKPRNSYTDLLIKLRKQRFWRETQVGFVRLERGFSVLDPQDPLELCPGVLDSIPETVFRLGTLGIEENPWMNYYIYSETTGKWYFDSEVMRYEELVHDQSVRLKTTGDSIRATYGWMVSRLLTYYDATPEGAIRFTAPIKPAVGEIWKDHIDENTVGMYSCWEPITDQKEYFMLSQALPVEAAGPDLPEY